MRITFPFWSPELPLYRRVRLRWLPFGGLSGVMGFLVTDGTWFAAGLAAFGSVFLLMARVLRED